MALDLDLPTAFYPPTPPADAAAGASRYPDSVLLDRKAYFDDRDNATTAVGETSTGHKIKITFCLADPPAVSYFCIHSPGLEDTHTGVPVVACSEKDLVVIHFSFNCQPGFHECFIYRAGHGKKPSFKRIPYPGPGIFVRQRILRDDSIGVVPFPSSGGDGEFLLVSLTLRSLLDYDVHIFSSKTEQWTTKRVPVQTKPNIWEDDVPADFTKVITLGGGVLGWVDLPRGILVCNVLELEQDPVLRIIQLPKPRCQASQYHSIKMIRDVTCNNGLIKFIDMEHLHRQVIVHDQMPMQMQNDPGSTDIIHDSDLAPQNDVREAAPAPKLGYVPDGWMLRSYYRHTSWDYWRMECILHCDDISIHNPRHYMLLPKLRCYSTGKLTLKYLISGYPSLSIHGDVVYLMTKVEFDHEKTWILGVHLGKGTLEVLEPYSCVRARFFEPDLCHYPFSKYLHTTPACLEATSAKCSESDSNNATLVSRSQAQNALRVIPIMQQ